MRRFKRTVQVALIVGCFAVLSAGVSAGKTPAKRAAAASSGSHATKSSSRVSRTSHSSKTRSRKSAARTVRGQQSPDGERTREIQTALIREHYLNGEATGSWDQQTRDALTRYQKDNGWQTKMIPDSRALIKLGLGPSREGLLNPDTAAISAPHLAGNAAAQPGGSAN